jgi:hypothetical protein
MEAAYQQIGFGVHPWSISLGGAIRVSDPSDQYGQNRPPGLIAQCVTVTSPNTQAKEMNLRTRRPTSRRWGARAN